MNYTTTDLFMFFGLLLAFVSMFVPHMKIIRYSLEESQKKQISKTKAQKEPPPVKNSREYYIWLDD